MANKKAVVISTLSQNIDNADTLLVGAGIDASTAGTLVIGGSSATSVVVTPSIGIGGVPTTKLDVTVGQLAVPAGTAGAPGIAIRGDLNNGIFSPGTDQLAVTTAGTQRMVVDASGIVVQSGFYAQSAVYFTGVSSPAALTTNQNDYAIGTAGIMYRLTSTAAVNITGIANGTGGRMIYVINVGANNIVLQNQNASSTEQNRIITGTGADLTLGADAVATLIYDAVSFRWRVVAVRQ